MKIIAQINFHYQNNDLAQVVLNSINPDNMGFAKSKVKENIMICEIKGKSLNTVLATIDDLIFSETVVEKILNIDEGEN